MRTSSDHRTFQPLQVFVSRQNLVNCVHEKKAAEMKLVESRVIQNDSLLPTVQNKLSCS